MNIIPSPTGTTLLSFIFEIDDVKELETKQLNKSISQQMLQGHLAVDCKRAGSGAHFVYMITSQNFKLNLEKSK